MASPAMMYSRARSTDRMNSSRPTFDDISPSPPAISAAPSQASAVSGFASRSVSSSMRQVA